MMLSWPILELVKYYQKISNLRMTQWVLWNTAHPKF